MASGKTDNLLKAILAEGKDPNTGEYLSPAERKAMFKKVKISGSKVFGRGGGGGNVRGGSRGSLPGAGGGALALRNPQADAMDDIANKLDNILVLIKRDADQERKQRAVQQESQRKAREKLLRGSAETQLESVNKEKEKKTDDAKKGIKMQIPFLEKLAKFLMIYVAGWASDKFIKMYQAALEGNTAELLKYRDILINQLGKLFAPVANIAGGFAAWIARTVGRITEFAGKIGKKVFTKFFRVIRRLAVGMLNRLKSIVSKPIESIVKQGSKIAQNLVKKLPQAGQNLLSKGGDVLKFIGKGALSKFNQAKGLVSKLPLPDISKKFTKMLSGSKQLLGSGMKKLMTKGIGPLLTSFLNIRERLGDGQTPTQAILGGILKGLAEGVVAGAVTSALTTAIPVAGFPLGLMAGGLLGGLAGNFIVTPLDEWFAKNYTPTEFDKTGFDEWASGQNDTVRAFLGLDRRSTNLSGGNGSNGTKPVDPQGGTGNQSRLSPGGATKNADVITPQRKPRVSTPAMPPVSAAAAQPAVQTVPNKQQITGLPVVNPTNEANPYLAFSYSVYNVLV